MQATRAPLPGARRPMWVGRPETVARWATAIALAAAAAGIAVAFIHPRGPAPVAGIIVQAVGVVLGPRLPWRL